MDPQYKEGMMLLTVMTRPMMMTAGRCYKMLELLFYYCEMMKDVILYDASKAMRLRRMSCASSLMRLKTAA